MGGQGGRNGRRWREGEGGGMTGPVVAGTVGIPEPSMLCTIQPALAAATHRVTPLPRSTIVAMTGLWTKIWGVQFGRTSNPCPQQQGGANTHRSSSPTPSGGFMAIAWCRPSLRPRRGRAWLPGLPQPRNTPREMKKQAGGTGKKGFGPPWVPPFRPGLPRPAPATHPGGAVPLYHPGPARQSRTPPAYLLPVPASPPAPYCPQTINSTEKNVQGPQIPRWAVFGWVTCAV